MGAMYAGLMIAAGRMFAHESRQGGSGVGRQFGRRRWPLRWRVMWVVAAWLGPLSPAEVALGQSTADGPPAATVEGASGHGPDGAGEAATNASDGDAPAATVDTLMDEALQGRGPLQLGGEKAARPTQPRLPVVPTVQALIDALTVVGPAFRSCAKSQSAMVEVIIELSGSTGARRATVTAPPFAGTAAGRCIEGVMRRARFPKFSRERYVVRVPLVFE